MDSLARNRTFNFKKSQHMSQPKIYILLCTFKSSVLCNVISVDNIYYKHNII